MAELIPEVESTGPNVFGPLRNNHADSFSTRSRYRDRCRPYHAESSSGPVDSDSELDLESLDLDIHSTF